jgi:hypothetical protein
VSKLFVRDRSGIRQVTINRLMTIGRSADNDVVLSASYASRRHAWVWRQGEEVILEDLGSTYGTLVNGERVLEPRFLRHHDVIQMGEAQLTFVAERDLSTVKTPPQGVPQLPLEQAFCAFCGALNTPGARYCAHCGYTLELSDREHEDGQVTTRSQPITPLEPVVARSFPEAAARAPRRAGAELSMERSDTRTWILILSLAIVAVILVTIVAVLLAMMLR